MYFFYFFALSFPNVLPYINLSFVLLEFYILSLLILMFFLSSVFFFTFFGFIFQNRLNVLLSAFYPSSLAWLFRNGLKFFLSSIFSSPYFVFTFLDRLISHYQQAPVPCVILSSPAATPSHYPRMNTSEIPSCRRDPEFWMAAMINFWVSPSVRQ